MSGFYDTIRKAITFYSDADVKVNNAKVQVVEAAGEGMKMVKIGLPAKI